MLRAAAVLYLCISTDWALLPSPLQDVGRFSVAAEMAAVLDRVIEDVAAGDFVTFDLIGLSPCLLVCMGPAGCWLHAD